LKKLYALILIVLIMASVFAITVAYVLEGSKSQINGSSSKFYFGVSFCGNTTSEAKLLVDKVKGYTNLFVVQSGPVSTNETSLNEIVDYAVGSNLDVIVFFGFFDHAQPWRVPWLDYAKQQWGNRFLGIYLSDEPGGSVIDANWTGYFDQIQMRNTSAYFEHVPAIDLALNGSLPIDNDQAALHFTSEVASGFGLHNLKDRNIPAFTSDYALYWFDYLSGYNTIFAEFGSNQSVNQAIALTRGAARLQSKDWGVIITWTYNQPPYLASGSEIYSQMSTAYVSGAKYVVIFNYPSLPGNQYGILTEDHFRAMQNFWNTVQNSGHAGKIEAEAVLVLPRNYGWGMRHPDDRVWGVWGPDATAQVIWDAKEKLLSRYVLSLDIVYEDNRFPLDGLYSKIYYWNETL
jgi:hypothetical protein